jgi:predicted nuclease with TOPRIM domain
MSEVKKLTTEELDEIKKIKASYNDLAISLGELEIEKSRLLEYRKNLGDAELVLAKKLQDKYGEGSINLETGEVNS